MIALSLLVCLFTGIQWVEGIRTLRQLTVQRGQSATIPCHYKEKHKAQVKYWCRGHTWDTCRVLVRSSSPLAPNAQMSISDDVTQHVFTVSMKNLQDRDSDVYWCAVDIVGPDDKAYLKIVVIPGLPELYTDSSVFSGPLGGLVRVRCLYAGRLRSSEKRWCRSGTNVCLTAGRTFKLHKYTLDLDPEAAVLTVTIRELCPKDTGWYWCTAGDTQLPVYVSVSLETNLSPVLPPKTTTFSTETTTLPQKTCVPEKSQQTTVTVHPDESGQTSVHENTPKIPSLEILLKIPVALVYLICMAVAMKKYCEMDR